MSTPKQRAAKSIFSSSVNSSPQDDNDPLQSIYSGRFSTLQFYKPIQATKWCTYITSRSSELRNNSVYTFVKKPSSIYRTARSYFKSQKPKETAKCCVDSLLPTFTDSFEIKPELSDAFEVNDALFSSKHDKWVPNKNDSWPMRCFTLRKYFAFLLLLFFFSLFFYAIYQPTYLDTLRLRTTILYNSVNYQSKAFQHFSSKEVFGFENFVNVVKSLSLLIPRFLLKSINKITGYDYVLTISYSHELRQLADKAVENKLDDIVNTIQAAHFKYQYNFNKFPTTAHQKRNQNICLINKAFLNLCNITDVKSKTIPVFDAAERDISHNRPSMSCSVNCYDDKFILSDSTKSFEKQFLATMKKVIFNPHKNTSSYFFHEWLQSKIANNHRDKGQHFKLESETSARNNIHLNTSDIQRIVETVVKKYMKIQEENITAIEVPTNYNTQYISVFQKLFKEMMLRYDLEKSELFDFALESTGGKVISTRQSENYFKKDVLSRFFGFFRLSLQKNIQNSPEAAIQPGMQPGQCWAFKGSKGYLLIQLSNVINPTGFTMEHIPASLSPSGMIDSAPKQFSVWGLKSETDASGQLLGSYLYNLNGYPLQYFPNQYSYKQPFIFVELRIHTNHGNPEYTCLYRFRVHGKINRQINESAEIF